MFEYVERTVVKVLFLMCPLVFVLSVISSASAYTMADVDEFMSSVRTNPSEYGADFTKGDTLYKEQFTRDGKEGYMVYLQKNGKISQKFIGWKVQSEGPCSFDGWPTYWDNRIYTTALVELTYRDGTTEQKLDPGYTATAARKLCVLFDEQEAYAGRFGVCFGVGSILHNIHYVCDPGSPYYNETVNKVPRVPPAPSDQTFPPTAPLLLGEFFPIEQCSTKITSFSGTSTPILDPSSGGSIPLTGTISDDSGKSIAWTMNVAGETYTGTGTSASVTWDGKDGSGKLVEPGQYSATLTAQTADGKCSDSKTVNFTVEPPPDNSCGLYVDFGSSANVASGALTHNQQLFSAKGSNLASGITLYYNSQDAHSTSLGAGWSHSYDISLKQNSDGSVVYRDGNGKRKFYTLSNGLYASRPGDYSTFVKNLDDTFILTQKDGLKYSFNRDGKIAAIIDRNGNTASFSYANGNLTAITDPVGRTTALTYDAANHITSIADPSNNSYAFTYIGGILASITYPDGSVWRYTYDANAFMLSKTDPSGNTTTYTYDAYHRVVSSTDPEGGIRSVIYPGSGTDVAKTTTFTEKDGGIWTYRYDTQAGTLTSKTDPQGGVTSYTYDANGNRLSTTAPDGSVAKSTYDARGNVLSITDSQEQTTTYTYNSFGQATSITDPQGKVTAYDYDANGNLTSLTDPAGATIRFEHDAIGNITKVTDPLGHVTSSSYDHYGNLVSTTNPAGETISFTYDAAGNMTSQTDASGAITRFAYNAMNQVVKVTDPLGNVISYTYDANGNKASQTDGNGNTTYYAYNYKGQLIKVTDPLGNATTYTYGATSCPSCGGGTDKLTAVTDAKGNITSYSYDSLGRLEKETDPLGNTITYVYDANGNLIAKTDANGNTVSQAYDAAGRLTGKGYPDGSQESYTYDGSGNLLTWLTPKESITYTYDAANRLTAKIYQNLGKEIKYEYDAAGHKSAMIDAEGGRTVYAYDAAGRVAKITDPEGNWALYSYDVTGRRSNVTYSNGTYTLYEYDLAGRVLKMTTIGPTGVISSYRYTYDKVGNRLSVLEAGGNSTAYTYDKLYRLTVYDETRPDASKGTFTYDAVGNRLSMVLAKKYLPNDSRSYTYTYNAENQLVNVVQKGRQSPIETVSGYDKNGSLLSQVITQGKTTSTTNYFYDYLNRLSKVITPDGNTVTIDNLSDGFSRLGKTSNSGITKYFHDELGVLSEYDSTGNRTSRYTLGFNIDEVIAKKDSAGTYFYNYDGLGNVTTITDERGKIVAKYDYEPFGRIKETAAATIENSFTFTGRELDKETGLYFYRARYYDPMEGRLISKDPIGFKGGINLYSYVKNNPMNFTDPSGLWQYLPGSGNNWCGPNWTGGSTESYTPGHSYAPPTNGLDSCCKAHDICYYECRRDHPCDLIERDQCMTRCDRQLAACAASAGHKYSSPLWWWMNFNSTPDPGPDASTCGK